MLFRFHDLRCGFYRFCIWLYRFFFYFHLRLLYFLNLRLDKNRLCFTLFSLDTIVTFQVQPCRQVCRQYPVQVRGDALHAAAVRIYHSRLAIGVGIPFRFGVDDVFRVVEKIPVGGNSRMVVLYDIAQPLVLFGKLFLALVLLQDNQVAPHLRVGIFREQVVRQADGGHQIRLSHHHVACAAVALRIQHALRGDECHDTAVTHRVQPFQKEIGMHLPCRYLFEYRAIGVFRVEHRYIPERDVGNGKVKPVQERLFYLLEAFRAYLLLRVQVSEHLARQQVFLESHDLRLRIVRQYRGDERAHARRRLQHELRAHLLVVEHVHDGVRDGLRRVERRQHRGFQRVHIPLVLRFVPAVLTDDTVQLHRRGEQFEVGLHPMHGIRQFLCRVQDALQPSEATVPLQQRTFPFRRGAPFPVKRERRAYRLDVVPQLLFPIERHRTPDKA